MIAAAVLLTIARTTLAPHAPRAAMCSVYLSRCHTACVPVRSVAALMQSAEEPPKLIPKKFSWQVTLSGAVCAALLWHLSTSRVPPLFALHVACMAPMLPLGTASITTVRQRLLMPNPPTDAAKDWRRKRAEWLVIRHFIASAALFLNQSNHSVSYAKPLTIAGKVAPADVKTPPKSISMLGAKPDGL